MSFQVKSAWVVACSTLVGSAFDFWKVFSMSVAGEMAAPTLPFVIGLTLLLAVFAGKKYSVLCRF